MEDNYEYRISVSPSLFGRHALFVLCARLVGVEKFVQPSSRGFVQIDVNLDAASRELFARLIVVNGIDVKGNIGVVLEPLQHLAVEFDCILYLNILFPSDQLQSLLDGAD
jgi:hypothetical protein